MSDSSITNVAPSDHPSATEAGHKGPYTRETIEQATREAQHGTGPYGGEAETNFSLWSIIGLAYAILNSWTAMASSLSVALPSGGQTAVIWGIVPSAIGNLCMALSMAEICSVFTTSGGQYHWAAVLAPADWAPLTAYISGWFCCAGWWALTATAGSLAGSLITGMISLAHESYTSQRYQIFLIYTAYTLGAMVLNVWGIRLLSTINKIAIIWSLAGATLIAVVCLATAKEKGMGFATGKSVFTGFINQTGWPNGVAWILGLLQSSFGLTAYDAVTHMVEEIPEPHINAPKAMILAVLIGSGSSFIFLICLLFCAPDVDAAISSPAGVLLASIYQATGSVAGSLCLQVFPVVSMAFAAQGILTSSSRMTQAFARDGGLPYSHFFAKANARTGVPDNAVYLTTILVIIFGLVYLGSSSALNAILSSSVVFLNISYCIPIALVLFRGRWLLRPDSFPEPSFSLGPIWGPICNSFGLIFTAITTVFFLFPPDIPATGSSMNYAVVVFFIIAVVAAITYVFKRKSYTGPRNLGMMLELARVDTQKREKIVENPALLHSKIQ